MDSPIFEQLFSSMKVDLTSDKPVYLQLSEILLSLIKSGKLKSGQKLPGTRDLAVLMKINRGTVRKVIGELEAQGWLESQRGSGTFVSVHISEHQPEPLTNGTLLKTKIAGYEIHAENFLPELPNTKTASLHLDDGYPDPRLAPLKEFYRSYRNQLTRTGLYDKFGSYGDPQGPELYRQAISQYLNETRGMNTSPNNILSVRGTLMGLNLVCNALVKPGDVVVAGIPGWKRVEHNFLHAKANFIGIPVDQHGIVVEALKQICEKQRVRMVYVTPNHHYPTTVPLRIDRRLELLKLATAYNFIIFEDDYDFDLHYRHRPLLPLASSDEAGMVIYCGSFSKSFSPAFRSGYLAAPENVIEHLARVRLLLDRQGDHITDKAIAELLNDGTIQRYIRRTLPVYEARRNTFCGLLHDHLKEAVNFEVPEGGMTVWTTFGNSINVEKLSANALRKGLLISDGKSHKYADYVSNSIRLGFASSTEEELEKSVLVLKNLIHRTG